MSFQPRQPSPFPPLTIEQRNNRLTQFLALPDQPDLSELWQDETGFQLIPRSSQDADFLLARRRRRHFTPESSPIPISRPVTPIRMSFTDMGAVVIDIDEIDRTTEVPKTPQ
jgi:hypothetical protein